jgi:hypothetical protein
MAVAVLSGLHLLHGAETPKTAPEQPAEKPAAEAAAQTKSGSELKAQEPGELALMPPRGAAAPAVPSTNVTVNLINRLVQRGLLPAEDAAELIKQAEADAIVAQNQAVLAEQAAAAATQAVEAVKAGLPAEPDPFEDDSMRVTYIPETVKAQLRDELRQEVMEKARRENWAAPRTLPEWSTRIRIFGDARVRNEGIYYQEGNVNDDKTGDIVDFNQINTGRPYDVQGYQFAPSINRDQDRQRLRLRTRVGLEADLGEGFTIGSRIVTGNNNSPVSANQSFGLANQQQGGNFSKYAIWLDRGFIKYQYGPGADRNLAVLVGRFDNPYFKTSEILWDDDLGFDGGAVQVRYETLPGVVPFFSGGAFPVFNTDLNFGSNQAKKLKSTDKWLYGGQLGVDWKAHKKAELVLGAGYHHFDGVEGKLSSPFTPVTAEDIGDTDDTRPTFAQKGNTYRPLRNIVDNALNDFGTKNQFQYFGLASPFEQVALSGKLDFNHFEPVQISLFGDWVKNMAFDRAAIEKIAVNNRVAEEDAKNQLGPYKGGDTAWLMGLRLGQQVLQKRWDWNCGVSYRHVESDALIDGFCDSLFGMGGTNVKGYMLFGNLALSARTWLGFRWMSADEVAGPRLKVDVLEFSYSGRF